VFLCGADMSTVASVFNTRTRGVNEFLCTYRFLFRKEGKRWLVLFPLSPSWPERILTTFFLPKHKPVYTQKLTQPTQYDPE
jgi:hypothetical protein